MMRNIFFLKLLRRFPRPKFANASSRTFTASEKRLISVFSTSEPNGNNDAWHKAVSEAEKVVGFPTSFLSLRALLSDEFGGLAIHLRKLVRTKHPLLNTARGIVFDSKNYLQTRGLVVLLVSKAATHNIPNEIYEKQRTLAEITELIHIAFLVHRGLVDVEDTSKQQKTPKADLEFGNKMAVLGGDFLLANACTCLAKLHNTDVVDLMSSSIEDMSSALILLPETGPSYEWNTFDNIPMTEDEWLNVFNLAHGNLLSNACRATMVLCGGSEEITKAAESMAHHLVLAQQAQHDILQIDTVESLEQKPNFCILCALPVVLSAEKQGGREWVKNTFIQSIDGKHFKIDVEKLFETIKSDKCVIKQANDICSFHIHSALKALEIFPNNEAKNALRNIILSVKQ